MADFILDLAIAICGVAFGYGLLDVILHGQSVAWIVWPV